jgi:hypothetical protein
VSDKIGWEGYVQQSGIALGADEALSRALGPAKESNYALESPKGVYSVGL